MFLFLIILGINILDFK